MEIIFVVGIFFTFAAIIDSVLFDSQKTKGNKPKSPANVSKTKSFRRVASHGTDVCQAAEIRHPKIGTLGLEDRKNDWLAKQLRAEAKTSDR